MSEQRAKPEPEAVPEWLRSYCPRCGAELASDCRYFPVEGYLILWVCEEPGCSYRRVL